LFYGALLQDHFVNQDARMFVNTMGMGLPTSGLHPLYGPVCGAIVTPLHTLGMPVYRAMTWVSALCTALAVWLAHAGCSALGEQRSRCALTAALFASTPAVVFFATVIEIPGVMLAFVGVAWWLACRFVRRPSPYLAVAIGMNTAVASLVHATGHVLPLVMLAFLWGWLPGGAWRPLRTAILLGGAHATVALLGKLWLSAGAPEGGIGGRPLDFFLGFERGFNWWLAMRSVWREWLLPFLPGSVLITAWLLRPHLRRPALALHAITAGYCAVSYVIIPVMWERGTYALPVAFPVALLTARGLPRAGIGLAAGVGLALGVWLVRDHDRPPDAAERPADVVAMAREVEGRALFLVAGPAESDPVLRSAAQVPLLQVGQLLVTTMTPNEACRGFDAYYTFLSQQQFAVFLTAGARAALSAFGGAITAHLDATYEMERHQSGALVSFRLRRRS